jgi:hypothetical protein
MITRRLLFHWCLLVVLALPQLAAPQARVAEGRGTNHKIGCTIHVQDREWTSAAPAIITGSVGSLTEGPLKISVLPILYLSPQTPHDEWNRYYAPVDLFRDGPLPTKEHRVGKKGKVVGMRPVPIKLTFKTKDDSVDFRVDARHVFWEKEIGANWPSRELFAAVEPGSYYLRLVLGAGDDGGACSGAAVVIVGSKAHPSIP